MPQGKIQKIRRFLDMTGWAGSVLDVDFLAAGEYNENFLITSTDRRYVFRVNHGSQLGIKNQIEYEFNVLQAVRDSGVTPLPFYYDNSPEGVDGGVLLMEYVQGNPLDYSANRDIAADIFSRIHLLPVSDKLLVQRNPIADIADESLGLINKYRDHPLPGHRDRLLAYHEEVSELGKTAGPSFQSEEMCIVNTEVNSGNFIIGENRYVLVDWEKAVVSYRYQDLGHFLVITTTKWKSDHIYSEEEKTAFLKAYYKRAHLTVSFDELREKTRLLEKTILLRALSWCFMAYYEYIATERALKNMDTFKKIKLYLDSIERFI